MTIFKERVINEMFKQQSCITSWPEESSATLKKMRINKQIKTSVCQHRMRQATPDCFTEKFSHVTRKESIPL